MTQHEQLLNKAVAFIALFPPKKKFNSSIACSSESDPWIAFLTPSVPNIALKLFGASILAIWQLVGPMQTLNLSTH